MLFLSGLSSECFAYALATIGGLAVRAVEVSGMGKPPSLQEWDTPDIGIMSMTSIHAIICSYALSSMVLMRMLNIKDLRDESSIPRSQPNS